MRFPNLHVLTALGLSGILGATFAHAAPRVPAPEDHLRFANVSSPQPRTSQIDATVSEWLQRTDVPSVSIAVVENGAISYVHAYGKAQLSPPIPVTTSSRYAIASNSKEFTAAAVLILAEQGRLSLEDRVGKWFPDLGAASRVTLRQLLTHTSGVRDYWPQDFVPPEMLRPTTVTALLNEWARRPLDFEPGTDWQYSNTGYVLAGAIVEKVAGVPLVAFLREHVFVPLKMEHVTEDDTKPLPAGDAVGYTRYGLGPPHRAPKEAPGWLYAAGELAMTPGDLALWDISLMNRSLLSAKSYEAALTVVTLADGTKRDYGLGLDIQKVQGRNRIGHTGEASGFLSANRIWPDDKAAIVVLTGSDWADADELVSDLAFVVLPPTAAEARARTVFAQYQAGEVDPGLFTDSGRSWLTPEALADMKASLGPLGPPRRIELRNESDRGGMVTRVWSIFCGTRRLEAVERGYSGGKLEQFMVLRSPD